MLKTVKDKMFKCWHIIAGFCENHALFCMVVITLLYTGHAFTYIANTDILDFDFLWTEWIRDNGFLNIYHMEGSETVSGINYPPMYPFVLYLISDIIKGGYDQITQICLFSFQVVMFIAAEIYFYLKISKKVALLWTTCLPFLFNVFCWGQRDAIFAFFIILMFINIEKHKVYRVVFWFTMLCLLKPQGALLLPILLLYLFLEHESFKNKVLAFCSGCVIGLLAFLPFIIRERSILTILNPYLFAGNGMSTINNHASNFWALLSGCILPSNMRFIIPLTFLIIIPVLFIMYKMTKDFQLSCFVYMFTMFMFAFGQLERYILYCFAILFFMLFISDNKEKYVKFGKCYKFLYIVSFLSQFIVHFILEMSYWLFIKHYPDVCVFDHQVDNHTLLAMYKYVIEKEPMLNVNIGIMYIVVAALSFVTIYTYLYMYTLIFNKNDKTIIDKTLEK